MTNKIVFGLLPSMSSAETALNNLQEADFDSKDISVVMQNEKDARQIAQDTGPLKGMTLQNLSTRLKQLGIGENTTQVYINGIKKNNVLIAIATANESIDVTKSVLTDYQTQQIVVV